MEIPLLNQLLSSHPLLTLNVIPQWYWIAYKFSHISCCFSFCDFVGTASFAWYAFSLFFAQHLNKCHSLQEAFTYLVILHVIGVCHCYYIYHIVFGGQRWYCVLIIFVVPASSIVPNTQCVFDTLWYDWDIGQIIPVTF